MGEVSWKQLCNLPDETENLKLYTTVFHMHGQEMKRIIPV